MCIALVKYTLKVVVSGDGIRMEKVPDGFVEMENKRTGGGCDGAGEMPTPGLLSKIPLVDPAS